MNRSLVLVTIAAALGLAACTNAPASEQNAAPAPQTQSSTPGTSTPAPPVVTEVVTSTVTNPPAPQAVTAKTDNRVGYGALKLGMTLDEARAAGLTKLTWEHENGDSTCVSDGKVTFSKKYGVVMIALPADAKTSKGIGIGSTYAEVKKAYADATSYRGGYSAKIDNASHYSFKGDEPGYGGTDASKVEAITIGASVVDCAMFLL
ncbi:hypothetical protein LFM09_24515 [Lentzea alba]|uniref:hypothetical protein n=1 Tax=Lentzea alba TaxID=2714351 RepID=UPI0039BF5BF1